MNVLFPVAIALALASVLVVLGLGIFNLVQARGSATPEQEMARARRSNKLMQWRVILQALALAIVFLAFVLASQN